MINLDGFEPAPVDEEALTGEDRWLLSRLATVTTEVTGALDRFQFADAARTFYDFAWDEFCSFYLEMAKSRLADAATRPVAQRVLAHALDTLLRLLHPFMPFLTEDVWQRLGDIAPRREIESNGAAGPAAESIMVAPWPKSDLARRNEPIEEQFAEFQTVLGVVREVRSRQNIPPKVAIQFSVRCDESATARLRPMAPFFDSMARATATEWGPEVKPPDRCASATSPGMEVFVDVSDFFDSDAERARLEKERGQLAGRIKGIESKLANDQFVSRAPESVVKAERDRLAGLLEQQTAVEAALAKL